MLRDLIFDFAGVTVTGVEQTDYQIIHNVTVRSERCSNCFSPMLRDHDEKVLRKLIADTPLWGKPSYIRITRIRHKCDDCGAMQVAKLPHVNVNFAMTDRLLLHIEGRAAKETMASIAAQVGISSDKTARVVKALIRKVSRHRFETPEVLGIDDLVLKRRRFTVFTNGKTGHAVGIIFAGKSDAIADWVRDHLDTSKVVTVVSDLAPANIAAVARIWPRKGRSHVPIHVADKWHVLKASQKAVTAVVNRTHNDLRNGKGLMAGDEKLMDQLKPYLLRGKAGNRSVPSAQEIDDGQLSFDFDDDDPDISELRAKIDDFMARYEAVSRAYWAKMRLHRLYNARTEDEAHAHAESFIRQCQHHSIAKDFESALKSFVRNRQIIFNFFYASHIDPDGRRRGVTNGPAERRNSRIRRSWRAACGMGMELLEFRATYETVDMIKLLKARNDG